MEQNLLFHGIQEFTPSTGGPKQENCKQVLLSFLQQEMEINTEEYEILKIHRHGDKRTAPGKVFHRPILAKVSYGLKETILKNFGKLKDKDFYITEQLPESLLEKKRHTRARLKVFQTANEKKEEKDKYKLKVINDTLYVNNTPDQPKIISPEPKELFQSIEEQRKMDDLSAEFQYSEILGDLKSTFQGFGAKVNSLAEAKRAYRAIRQMHPAADHIMAGYTVKDNGVWYSGHVDDEEYAGGIRIKKVIQAVASPSAIVFVVRYYGGQHLGAARFGYIDQAATEVVNKLYP